MQSWLVVAAESLQGSHSVEVQSPMTQPSGSNARPDWQNTSLPQPASLFRVEDSQRFSGHQRAGRLVDLAALKADHRVFEPGSCRFSKAIPARFLQAWRCRFLRFSECSSLEDSALAR
jgi:hypothetical protein